MQDKIIEIIVYILNEVKSSKQLNDIDFNYLLNNGYSDSEINTAFAWIYSKLDNGEKIFKDERNDKKSRRFLHKAEKNIISTEASGYLIMLRELGLLSDADEELILERIIYSGIQKVNIKEIKNFIASLIFDFENKSEILERLVIQNNDTIH
jgi:uncharacterized protein Smg (DUF494 family)